MKIAESCLTLCLNSLGQNTGEGSLSLLQGISQPRDNPGLLHCRQIVYQLNHKGSPRILEWVAYPFSSRSSRPRNWTGVSCIEGDSFPTELSGNSRLICFIHIFFIMNNWTLRYWKENNVALNTLSAQGLKIKYFHSFLTRDILCNLSDLDFKV